MPDPAKVDADAPVPVAAVPPASIPAESAAPAPAVVAAAPAPVVVETPPAAPPVAPAPVVAEEPKTVVETPSLLETVDAPGEVKPEEKPAEVKPAEVKPAEVKADDKPTEAPPAEPPKPAELPKVEYKYEIPENLLTLPDERRTQLHETLDNFRADPSNVQPLIDFHLQAIKDYAAQVGQHQHKQFNDTRAAWQKEIQADPELGGNGYETTKQAVARMRDLLVSSAKPGTKRYAADLKAASEFFRVTGSGDHPVMWRMLHNVARFLDEPPVPSAEIGVPKDNGRGPNVSRRDLIYNHPSSQKAKS
jgi:hypothetical protein